MTETTARYEYQEDDRDEGLNWARIAGISAAIAVHVAALMLLMAPVSPPPSADEQADRVDVQFIEPPPPPPPPPPMPVGVVGTGTSRQAIFLAPGSSELRVGVGGALPDGGRVLAISGMTVAWVDGAGERHERRMFIDPAQLPAGDAVR